MSVGSRGDKFIKAGFWSQLILLFLVDWGSILAFMRYDVPAYHYVGFVVLNVVLLYATYVMWRWLGPQESPRLGGGAPWLEE